jgi:hydrogenase maturation protein HypF
VIDRRAAGEDPAVIAGAFHNGLAAGVKEAVLDLCDAHNVDTVVLSGGVFQNELLRQCLSKSLSSTRLRIRTNDRVPPNDGGISLGQAAFAAATRPCRWSRSFAECCRRAHLAPLRRYVELQPTRPATRRVSFLSG